MPASDMGMVLMHSYDRKIHDNCVGDYKRIVLPVMIEAGLITRREGTPPLRLAKPYFITDEGRRYLEEAKEKALFPQLDQRIDWTKRVASPELQKAVNVYVRSLPEFRESDDDRIQEVTQKLAAIMARSASKKH